jgi:hypothetical protein
MGSPSDPVKPTATKMAVTIAAPRSAATIVLPALLVAAYLAVAIESPRLA